MPIRPALAAACLLALAGPASAADPVPLQPGPGELLTTPPGLRPIPETAITVQVPDADMRADVILGLPVAVRAQARVFNTRLWVEAGGGFYLIFPGVFAGLRFDSPTVGTRSDTFALRPGVTAWYIPAGTIHGSGWFGGPNRAAGIFAGDVDVLWNHRWSGRFHSEVGLKAGLGVGVANGVFPAPFLGLIAGCHY